MMLLGRCLTRMLRFDDNLSMVCFINVCLYCLIIVVHDVFD
ncbi:hypothetical protein [Candidatus Hodgkinia cicadicola]